MQHYIHTMFQNERLMETAEEELFGNQIQNWKLVKAH